MSCGICLRSAGFYKCVLWLVWVGGWDREILDDGNRRTAEGFDGEEAHGWGEGLRGLWLEMWW